MRGYLLDTFTFLWMLQGTLDDQWTKRLSSPEALVLLSAVSAWEIAIKRSLGNLSKDCSTATECHKHRIRLLGLDAESADLLGDLPDLHKDPFDRMLICQTIRHNYCLITSDQRILKYCDYENGKLGFLAQRVQKPKEAKT